MRSSLAVVLLGLVGACGSTEAYPSIQLGSDLQLVNLSERPILFTGFVVQPDAEPRPLYVGGLGVNPAEVLQSRGPAAGATVRFRFVARDREGPHQIGSVKVLRGTWIAAVFQDDDVVEIDSGPAVGEYEYRGGTVGLRIGLEDDRVVVTAQ